MMELPRVWDTASLGKLVAPDGIFTDGDWVESKDQDPNGEVRLIQLADIADSQFLDKSSRFLTREKADELNCTFLKKGDLMVARMPDPLGRCCIFPLDGENRFVTVVDVCAIRLGSAEIDPQYLMHAINSPNVRTQITALQSGSTRKRISRKNLATVSIPIAPLNEQRRIVERIEALFEEIDRGGESLRAAKNGIALYRQSLLKSAFEGRLTAEWRAQNPDKLESQDALLARIREERERRYRAALEGWERAVARWKKIGKAGRRPSKPKQPPELEVLSVPNQLPSNWVTLMLKSLGRIQTGATPSTKESDNFGGNIPFFKPTDLDAGDELRESRESLSETGARESRRFSAGAILVTCIGATIGKTGLVAVDAACNQQINFVEPDVTVQPKFIYYQVISPFFQGQIKSNASSTTLPILNKGKFAVLPVSISSAAEQAEIVRILDIRLDAARKLNVEIDTALAQADALRQSILKKAFAGQLVPQDADDEPASALLERMQAGRARTPVRRRRTRVEV